MKGATIYDKPVVVLVDISIHAPVKGATFGKNPKYLVTWNFNPRSREGSDGAVGGLSTADQISIHAPVKGATRDYLRTSKKASISIHAPVKGATGAVVERLTKLVISIHAPVKGAT